ncbi:MAG: metal ABC transporter ATP-binding protein [Bacteroidaceae bacterium]|nr:metal ABC transporter ATP-binding protein [Bacteroidaceae bacterium]
MQYQDKYIELKDITLTFDNRTILKGVNLTLNRGDFMLVVGANGGGKTSLIRVMLGLQKPTSGEVLYYDKNFQYTTLAQERVGYLPQKNSLDLRFPISVREVVESGLIGEKNLTKSEAEKRVGEMLGVMQLADLQSSPIGEVSGGQFQRALFARAIISNPSLLVLDEPTSYLDNFFTQKLYAILQQLSPSTTIVVVTHDNTTYTNTMANRVIYVGDRNIEER